MCTLHNESLNLAIQNLYVPFQPRYDDEYIKVAQNDIKASYYIVGGDLNYLIDGLLNNEKLIRFKDSY